MIVYVIVAVLFFGVLVGIHEFGHFAVAKACGIRVEEFSVGMGPAVFKKQKGETLYSLRCIPFGGYCAIAGMVDKNMSYSERQKTNPTSFWYHQKEGMMRAAASYVCLL